MQGINQLSLYDRQLRIWGTWGQVLLEKAHICLISPETALLQETVKHLVLLGISNFTWLYLNRDYIKSKSSSSKLLFKDLVDEMSQLRSEEIRIRRVSSRQDIKDYSNFSVIIVLNNNDKVDTIFHHSQTKLPPILTVQTAGFYGFLKLTLSEPHFVLDPHNEYQQVDLRLDRPWRALKDYMDDIKMKGMDIDDAAKYPYPVILAKMLQELIRRNTSSINTTVIKDSLEKIYCSEWVHRGYESMNYLEAQRFAFRTITKPEHDQFIKTLNEQVYPYLMTQMGVLKDKWCDPMNRKIWYLITTLIEFIEETEMGLPLQGDLPDMECDNSEYQKFKAIYDIQRSSYLDLLEHKLQQNSTNELIDRQVLEIFSKNILDLTIIKPLENGETAESSELYKVLTQNHDCRYNIQVQKHKFHKISEPSLFCVDVFLAGLVAQETIKLITHQFVPINNTFVYDGYDGTFTEIIRV